MAATTARGYTRLMPSHVAHLLFVEDLVRRSPHASTLAPLCDAPTNRWLALAAQGPDLFFHNQRSRPTGIAYGSLMHRRGYGSAVAAMWRYARERELGVDSWAGAWVIGFASHAVLDRHTHPYINAMSGWAEPGEPETDRYRSMHPFLERLIDVELLRRERGIHPNELDFAARATIAPEPPEQWLGIMAAGLRGAYRKARDDGRLHRRLEGAYRDTIGYYRFTNRVDRSYLEGGLEREERGEIGSRWLGIVHPPEVPDDIDVLNLAHREWPHPCSVHERHRESFPELLEQARTAGVSMADAIVEVWNAPPDEGAAAIAAAVGEWNLSDGRPTERPCRKRHATPLPLPELQERIRESIRHGRGGRLERALP